MEFRKIVTINFKFEWMFFIRFSHVELLTFNLFISYKVTVSYGSTYSFLLLVIYNLISFGQTTLDCEF